MSADITSNKLHELPKTYSEEFQDVVGQAPRGLIRWGMIVLCIIMGLIIGIGFLVQYADIVRTQLTIMAGNAPKAVIAKLDGKLVRIWIKDKVWVKKGAILAFMESTATHEEVIALANDLNSLLMMINKGNWDGLQAFKSKEFGHLGELQPSYQTFMQSFIQIQSYLDNGFYIKKKRLIQEDLKNNEAMGKRLEIQLQVHEKDLLLAKEDFNVKEQLYKDKVLPLLEYREEESKLLNKQIPPENARSALINNAVSTSAKQQELLLLDQQFIDQKNGFIQAMNALINDVKKWESQYLLIAPDSGMVTFPVRLQENQDVKTGQELYYITRPDGGYYGEMSLPQENFGKVKVGQLVLLKLSSYPYQEYGRLTGTITYISDMPNKDKQYTALVALNKDLITDYGRKLTFSNALIADAEVVTKRTKLINKFLYTIRAVWNKSS